MSAPEQIKWEFAHFAGGTRVLAAAVRSKLQHIERLLASSFLDSPRAPLHRGSLSLLPRRLAAYGRNAPDPFISRSSTPQFTKCSPPASTPVHVSQSKRDQRIPFLACLARWFPHLEIHFLQTSHGTAAWCGMPPTQICASFLLWPWQWSFRTLPNSPQPSASLAHLPTHCPKPRFCPPLHKWSFHSSPQAS